MVEKTISEFRIEEIPLSCTWFLIGPPGSGKCFAEGTPILMFDGTLKNVEDITVGDFLMGDDSNPREVLSTTSGTDNMFKIKQDKGDDYIVNEPHILVLKREMNPTIVEKELGYDVIYMKNNVEFSKTFLYEKDKDKAYQAAVYYQASLIKNVDYTTENLLEISVRDYLDSDVERREKYKGYKQAVDFYPVTESPVDSMSFGMWLGGGSYQSPTFKCSHPELVYALKENIDKSISIDRINETEFKIICKDVCGISPPNNLLPIDGENYFMTFLRRYDLLNSKHIPREFKNATRDERNNLLHGFLCTATSVGEDTYEVDTEILANDILYLARSCGVNCSSSVQNHKYHITFHKTTSSNIEIEPLGQGTYYGFQITGNQRFLLGDFTVTHNTTMIKNLAYFNKHRYPVARAFMGTEGGYQELCEIFHPLYVSNYYDEEEEKNHIHRQRKCVIENDKGYPGNYAINILDDVSDDPRIYKSKVMRGIFKLGSQHWAQLAMVGSQYAIDLPTDIRTSVSYVAIFREPDDENRKKLYKNFGGITGSYQNFCSLMDQLTGDYTCIVLKRRSQSNDLEDCVFFYKTVELPKWKFGCKEYHEWAEKRYNKDYKEKILF